MIAATTSLLTLVRQSKTVLLTGPEGPDGDSIGAALALQRCLAALAPEVRVDVAGAPGARYAELPGAREMVRDADVRPDYDGVVVLDGDATRLVPPVEAAFRAARWTGLIDHHRSTDPAPYTVALLDPTAESTCGMVAAMGEQWGVARDASLATLLYAGIIFDTGGFRYSNTHASTHRLAAELLETGFDHAQVMLRVLVERRPQAIRLLGRLLATLEWLDGGRVALATCRRADLAAADATEADLEGVVDLLQHTEGVDLGVVAVEKTGDRVKLSLRSRGRVDVAALARSMSPGGGGHAKAAGVVLPGAWESVLPGVRERLIAAVREA